MIQREGAGSTSISVVIAGRISTRKRDGHINLTHIECF